MSQNQTANYLRAIESQPRLVANHMRVVHPEVSREAPKVDPETTVSLECPTSPPDVEEEEEDEREGDRNDDADSVASSSKSLRDRKPRRTSTRNEEKSQVR